MRVVRKGRHIDMEIPIVRIWCDNKRLHNVPTIPQALRQLDQIAISINDGIDAFHRLVIR